MYMFLKCRRVICHHDTGFVERQRCRVISARPGIVKRCLIGAEIDMNAGFVELLPYINNVSLKSDRYDLLCGLCFFYTIDKGCDVTHDLIHPALPVSFYRGAGIDLCYYRDTSGYVARFRLGAAHAAKSRRNKYFTGKPFA